MTSDDYKRLYDLLKQAQDEIDSAPERFDSTAAGYLAESDAEAFTRAASVAHRLYLWRKHPTVDANVNYLPPVDLLQLRANQIHAADVAQDANYGRDDSV